MISNDFIISSLNITNDDIEDIDIIKSKDILFICLKLKDKHTVCPYCGFDAKIKDYKNLVESYQEFSLLLFNRFYLIIIAIWGNLPTNS